MRRCTNSTYRTLRQLSTEQPGIVVHEARWGPPPTPPTRAPGHLARDPTARPRGVKTEMIAKYAWGAASPMRNCHARPPSLALHLQKSKTSAPRSKFGFLVDDDQD